MLGMLIAVVAGVFAVWIAALITSAIAFEIYRRHFTSVIFVGVVGEKSMRHHCFWCAFWIAFIESRSPR